MALRHLCCYLAAAAISAELSIRTRPGNDRIALLDLFDLRAEALTDPLILDNPNPRLSWATSAGPPPTAFRVVVGTDASLAPPLLWDSAVVAGLPPASGVTYGGAPLPGAADVFWRADVLAAGVWANSSTARFGTAPTADAWLGAAWVGGFPQLRSAAFALAPSQPLLRARAFVTGVGAFELRCNGVAVTRGGVDASGPASWLNPGMATLATTRLLVQAYDVTALLRAGGENVLGLRLGSNKWGYLTEFCPSGDPDACNAGVVLLVVDADAGGGVVNRSWVRSGADWRGTHGPVTQQALYIGETYDARLEQPGWASPTFANASAWAPVHVAPSPTAALSAHAMDAITTIASGPALSVTPLSANGSSWLFDCGVNGAGTFSLHLEGPLAPGVTLQVSLAERTAADGSAFNAFPCPSTCCPKGGGCSSMLFVYTTRGGATDETYTPTFSSGGYRWAQVDVVGGGAWPGPRGAPAAADFTRILISSAVELAPGVVFGSAADGDGNTDGAAGVAAPSFTPLSEAGLAALPPHGRSVRVLNALQAAVVASQRSNLLSHPTDCPTRERRGWGGDASVSVHEAVLNARVQPLYENWLRVMRDTQAVGCAATKRPNNTCGVFHDALLPWERKLLASDRNGPGERPDCYLCCPAEKAAGGGFGCVFLEPDVRGSLPDIMPVSGPSRSWPGSMCWTSAAFTVADALRHTYGDVHAGDASFEMLYDLLDFYSRTADASGLLTLEAYGDWVAPAHTTPAFMANAFYVWCALLLADVATATGRPTQAAALVALASHVSAATGARYLLSSGSGSKGGGGAAPVWDTGSQAASSAALVLGLGGDAGAAAAAAVLDSLVRDIEGRGHALTVGTLGSRFVLQALSAGGRGDVALALASSTARNASWGWMLASDAAHGPLGQAVGTLWESWVGGAGGVSLNHAMLGGGVGLWLHEDALGLRVRHRTLRAAAEGGGVGAAAEEDAAARNCLNALALAQDVRSSLGLSARDVCAAAAAAAALRSGALLPRLGDIAAHVAHAAASPPTALPVRPAVGLTAELHLELPLLEGLREARGGAAPLAGPVTASWRWGVGGAGFSARVAAPAGAAGVAFHVPRAALARLAAARASAEVVLRVTPARLGTSAALELRVRPATSELVVNKSSHISGGGGGGGGGGDSNRSEGLWRARWVSRAEALGRSAGVSLGEAVLADEFLRLEAVGGGSWELDTVTVR